MTLAAWALALAAWPPVAAAQAPAVPAAPADTAAATDATLDEQTRTLLRRAVEADRPSPAAVLARLREAVARATASHPDTLAALAGARGAGEALREVAAARRPQILLQAEASARHTDPSTVLDSPGRRYETGSLGVTMRQLVTDFGASAAAMAAGTDREQAQIARTENRAWDVALRAIGAWSELYRARQQVALSELNVRAYEFLVAQLVLRHQLGGGPLSDVWRAQARQSEARSAATAALARQESAVAAYVEAFAGAAPHEAALLALPMPDAPNLAALGADPLGTLTDFPAMRSARLALRAAENERESVALRERLPRVDFELSGQRRDLIGAGRPGLDASTGLTLRYNFYTGGAASARVGQATQRAAEASEQARSVEQQLQRALAQAVAEAASHEAILRLRREGVEHAARAMGAVRELFLVRRGSVLDLLDAQQGLHNAGLALLDAEVQLALGRWRVLYFTPGFRQAAGIGPIAP